MTQIIRCDRCGKIVEKDDMRAVLSLDIFGVPGGTVQTSFGPLMKQRQVIHISKDLCVDCTKDLCAYLKVDVPEVE